VTDFHARVPGNRVSLLHDSERCLPALLEAIESAEIEVLLEMYWFASDAWGLKFARALADRARHGVRVCVSYDAVGSFDTDRAMFVDLVHAGCDVYEYNPLELFSRRFSFRRMNRRNHRKLLVIDGKTAFTGGVNIGNEWGPLADGGKFRDDLIRVDGPAAAAMRAIFVSSFRGKNLGALRGAELPVAAPAGNSSVEVLTNQGYRKRRVIEHAYLDRIRTATRCVLITNSYFIPRSAVRRALAQAVRRGVDVRVLLPTVSDVPAVTYATRRLYGTLLRSGVQLFEWSQSILHSKTAVVDGAWCTVGSHNVDYRSWAYNLELNVMVEDDDVAQALERRMLADMEKSGRVDLRTWLFRPLGQRILEELFYLLRRFL
jgi:cardiolipin synthase A/B